MHVHFQARSKRSLNDNRQHPSSNRLGDKPKQNAFASNSNSIQWIGQHGLNQKSQSQVGGGQSSPKGPRSGSVNVEHPQMLALQFLRDNPITNKQTFLP